MKQITITLLTIFLSTNMIAQSNFTYGIRGRVIDFKSSSALQYATINCLRSIDSSRISSTYTNEDGSFSFEIYTNESCFLYITFLGYQPLMLPIKKTNSSSTINFGEILLKKTNLNLPQIEITENKQPLKIQKDTLEFNAAYFKTNKNSNLEDLLKLIPGIHIDQNGAITINGEFIGDIMINGRYLFKNAPKDISRNLQADLIDKIQIINSSQGGITPNKIGEERSDKIINLIIKKNKKNLVTGELTGGYGTSNRFVGKANLSHFTDSRQLLIFASGDNANGAVDSRPTSNPGIQQNINSGISYSDMIGKKITININYQLQGNLNEEIRNSSKQTLTTDSSIINHNETRNKNQSLNNSLFQQLVYEVDSMQEISLTLNGSIYKFNSKSDNSFDAFNQSGKINEGVTTNKDEEINKSLSANIGYEKKFKKSGRILEIQFSFSKAENTSSQFNLSHNRYYPKENETISDTIDQNVKMIAKSQQVLFVSKYAEPIIKDGQIILTIAEDYVRGTINRSTNNYDNTKGSYIDPIDSLSNKLINRPIQHYLKFGWFHKINNIDYSLSVASIINNMSSKNAENGDNISNHTVKILPDFNLKYTFHNKSQIRMFYRKSITYPDVFQLQSIIDNTDPLNIKKGNSKLKPGDNHNINLTYRQYNPSTLNSLLLSFEANIMHNQIVNTSQLDSVGRQISYPINLDGGYNLNLSLQNNLTIKKQHIYINTTSKGRMVQTPNSINSLTGTINEKTLAQSIGLYIRYRELYNYNVTSSINYNTIRYSALKEDAEKFVTGGFSFAGCLNLPYEIIISSDVYFGWTTGRAAGYNASPILINFSISKYLFSNQQGLIQLQGFDLLKQNTSLNRSIGGNFIEDTKSNILERFFLLKMSYYLGKKK